MGDSETVSGGSKLISEDSKLVSGGSKTISEDSELALEPSEMASGVEKPKKMMNLVKTGQNLPVSAQKPAAAGIDENSPALKGWAIFNHDS